MNSTDKSIATIDIALRRRFTFLKMKPSLELVEDSNAKNMMKKLNSYIANTLGEDYQLGHSYFMKVQNDDDLEFIKEYKIKPLLEEYFYAEDKSVDEILKEALANSDG
jgi:5-methylcytosine-specific restriction protein B